MPISTATSATIQTRQIILISPSSARPGLWAAGAETAVSRQRGGALLAARASQTLVMPKDACERGDHALFATVGALRPPPAHNPSCAAPPPKPLPAVPTLSGMPSHQAPAHAHRSHLQLRHVYTRPTSLRPVATPRRRLYK